MDGREARLGRLDPGLLADPLDFLSAEHARQRALLGHLERLARKPSGPARVAMARALAAWLACELPLHLRDEEESLYPRIASTAGPVTRTLAEENRAAAASRAELRAELALIATGHRPSDRFTPAALEFAAGYRRHLAVEEFEVMPAARRSLSGIACDAITREMAARRGRGDKHA
ncbi:MAG TPA: hemerythrin domain-containing protein [Falsiroseomonas sp.]|jgi:hemerythrin-like domain-containing protein|nr:hemerythrin domain-containing protein [Falsiroseomonas sp.]